MPLRGKRGRIGARYVREGPVFGGLLPARMGESSGQEYWVDPVGGSDGNSGTAIGSAKASINGVYSALASTSGARIWLRTTGEHDLGGSALTLPNTKFGVSRDNPITMETWPADMNSQTGMPGTRNEARVVNGELRFQPSLTRMDYNSGNGLNVRLRNLVIDEIPGATTAGGQGTGINGIRCDNVIGFEVYGCHINAPSFCGILIRGAGNTTTLSGSMTNSTTTMNVSSATNFANATPFYAVIGNGDGVEIVRVDSTGSGTNWTVVRGQKGTTAVAHNSGVTVEGYWQSDDVQLINCKIDEPSDGTAWAIDHSHGIYWASDNGLRNTRRSCILNCLLTRRNASRGGAYGISCYENGDGTIVSNVISDGFRRGGMTISGEAVHATDDSLWINNILTNMQTTSPGPGYAMDSYMTGAFGPGSNNLVDTNLWFTGLDDNRTDSDANGITFTNWINDDPDYTNRSTGDYHPLSGSPGKGVGDIKYMFPTDIEGNVRTLSNYGLGPFVYT